MIDVKAYADHILDQLKAREGGLAVISVGDNPASKSYIAGKKKDCERCGFHFEEHHFEETTTNEEVMCRISALNFDPRITGIIVQLPLPAHLDTDMIVNTVFLCKDVDGFRTGSPYRPCTPEGVIYILKKQLGDLTGKHVAIIGRGRLVGLPLMDMLLEENATITVCHSKTQGLGSCICGLDAVVSATGKPTLGYGKAVPHHNAVVVDCGIRRGEDGKLHGDVDPNLVDRQTPVPGGVGLMTRAALMAHVAGVKRLEELL